MRTTEIVCDMCGRDLTSTGNCEGYRLAVVNERIPSRGGIVTAMAVYPALSRDYHFCGIGCLQRHNIASGLKNAEQAQP